MTLYLYKDKFMSGWGNAPKGSYVVTDKKLKRSEFKLLGQGSKLSDFTFRSGKGKDFEYWMVCKSEKGQPVKNIKLKVVNGKLSK